MGLTAHAHDGRAKAVDAFRHLLADAAIAHDQPARASKLAELVGLPLPRRLQLMAMHVALQVGDDAADYEVRDAGSLGIAAG